MFLYFNVWQHNCLVLSVNRSLEVLEGTNLIFCRYWDHPSLPRCMSCQAESGPQRRPTPHVRRESGSWSITTTWRRLKDATHETWNQPFQLLFLGKPNQILEWEWIPSLKPTVRTWNGWLEDYFPFGKAYFQVFGNIRTINYGHKASLQCWNSMIFVNVCKSAMCKTKLNCPLPVFHWQRSPGWNIERLRILCGICRYHFCCIGV